MTLEDTNTCAWASFTREDNRNITVGHCSRDSTQEYFHGGMTISFNRTQNTCTLELPSQNQQQDGGIYSCTLWTKAESDKIAIISRQKATVTSGVPDPIQEQQVLSGVIGGGLGGVFVLLVLVAIAICYKWRKNGKTKVINSILQFNCIIPFITIQICSACVYIYIYK